ncbi:MAG: ATP-binding protein [Methanomassiliicoccus sp.]|nr:ATP-binding protein [Methanomassiliicoccus sp.]
MGSEKEISQRSWVDEGFSDNELEFRGIFENLQEAVVLHSLVFDEGGEIVDGTIINANPAAFKAWGLRSIEEARCKRGSQLVSDGLLAQELKLAREARTTGRPVSREISSETADRHFLLTVVPMKGDRILFTSVEITEQKRAQRRAEENEILFRSIFENNVDAVLLTKPSGDVLMANPAAQRMFGMAEDEFKMVGREGILVRDHMLESALKVRMQGGQIAAELTFRRKDGSTFPGEVTSSLFTDADRSISETISIRDITERKKAEENLKRSNDELQQFAYLASHDLQEPLRMVTSYLGLLDKKFGSELNAQAKEYMSYAVDGAVRMKQLIDDLLQYSRVDSRPIEISEVDMSELAQKAADEIHVSITEAKATLVIGPLPTIHADRAQMMQVLTNLISNAIKFRDGKPPRVEVSAILHETENVFSVQDNGIGIDPKYAEKMFKMFSRLHTKEEYPGTGIGLAICKKIVERHGGRIWFESEPGKGTTFFFTIPL